jgi:hypothetical protein
VLARDLRPMSVVSSRDRPGGSRRRLEEAVEERLVHRALDDQPRPGQTDLPALSNWFTACFTVASKSASANATNGDFPPSSSDTGVRFAAAACATSLPVSIEPVNAIRSTSGAR